MAANATETKPKPYTLLTVVQSESGSWSYEIRTSHRDGKTYCTCRGFIFHKRCKHMDAFLANPQVKTSPVVTTRTNRPAVRKSLGAWLRDELVTSFNGRRVETLTENELRTVAVRFEAFVTSLNRPVASSSMVVSEDTINASGVRVITLPD